MSLLNNGYSNRSRGTMRFAAGDNRASECVPVELSEEEKAAIFARAEKKYKGDTMKKPVVSNSKKTKSIKM